MERETALINIKNDAVHNCSQRKIGLMNGERFGLQRGLKSFDALQRVGRTQSVTPLLEFLERFLLLLQLSCGLSHLHAACRATGLVKLISEEAIGVSQRAQSL